MEQNYSYLDSSNQQHDIVLNEDSFKLKQRDQVIHDTKLSTKPTTFIKDALKRFAKSKAALVSTIILGIIVLLSLILPAALPFDTTGKVSGTQYLPPKIFSAGTGFWDGTKKYKDIVYNPETELPDGNYQVSAILNGSLSTYSGTIENTTNKFAKGGYIRIGSSGKSEYVWSSSTYTLNPSDNIELSYEIDSHVLQQYDAVPYYVALSKDDQVIELLNSSQYGQNTINVSDKISNVDANLLENCSLRIGINAVDDEKMIGVFVKNFSFKVNGSNVSEFSFDDANSALLNKKISINSANLSGLSQAEITLCSFTYDPYSVAYGSSEYIYSKLDFEKLIESGDIEYDFDVGISSFKALKDTCPITDVISQDVESAGGITVITIKTIVSSYKQKGYKTMPYHVFGTDADGVDMLKYVFEGTRNSLALAVIISAICFIFGLCFGAIEGYFGGTVDLVMERFVEILSNIPSIILITLMVLKMGQTFSVFMLAMCMTGWISTSGITRTQFYRFKRREYVLASRSLGASDTRLIFKHILPNSLGTIITSSVLMIPGVIYSEATIAYLGIGLSGKASLGNILSTNQVNIASNQYLLIFPAALLAVMLICFNLFGNGLRDALNPSLKGSE